MAKQEPLSAHELAEAQRVYDCVQKEIAVLQKLNALLLRRITAAKNLRRQERTLHLA